ncbi:Cyanovirin-N [Apiospora arundinis]|uniref:Cyanovirin-N domain-containing protein n=1 Tax=Apiospora arundinis TaxID=335852 RepID=A0ABR2J953_9PEZI
MSSLTLASTGSNFSLTCNNIWINDKDLELWNILYVQAECGTGHAGEADHCALLDLNKCLGNNGGYLASEKDGDFLTKGNCTGLSCDYNSNGGDPTFRCSCPHKENDGNIAWSSSWSHLDDYIANSFGSLTCFGSPSIDCDPISQE